MIQRMLNIGEVHVTSENTGYVCYGLGSCIALFLTDNRHTVSGGAHIALPKSSELFGSKGAEAMINELIYVFKSYGYQPAYLTAKIAGGSKVTVGKTFHVGDQNIQAVKEVLQKNGITIISSDVGGHEHRTVQYLSKTGDLIVSTLNKEKITL
jgi:chemotaxis protein CheD